MSVRIGAGTVVVRRLPESFQSFQNGPRPAALSKDGTLTAAWFENESARREWVNRLTENGIARQDIISFDAAGDPVAECEWIRLERLNVDEMAGWIDGSDRGDLADLVELDSPPFQRHEILSRSESGLHFVRERTTGILRQLTDDELHDFSDPAPCLRCGEQFGCEHRNCANEPLLSDAEIRETVPPEWARFARECGISRNDLQRLEAIVKGDDGYRLRPDRSGDMRTMELILLLNGDE